MAIPGAAPTRADEASWPALALAIAVPLAYSLTANFGQLAMANGSDALAASSTRVFFAAVVFALYAWWTRLDLAIPARHRTVAWLLGAGHALTSWSLYLSFRDIPIGVAILILYAFPFITAIVSWIQGRSRPTVGTVSALIIAFIGLLLAIDLGGGEIRLRGVAYALASAVGFATIMLVSERLFEGGSARPRMFHTLSGGVIANILILAFIATPVYPTSALGWVGVWGNSVCYAFAIIGLFVAVARLGAIKMSTILNLEPISTIALGWLLHGQRLTPLQLVGAALVIAAVIYMSRPRDSQAK